MLSEQLSKVTLDGTQREAGVKGRNDIPESGNSVKIRVSHTCQRRVTMNQSPRGSRSGRMCTEGDVVVNVKVPRRGLKASYTEHKIIYFHFIHEG